MNFIIKYSLINKSKSFEDASANLEKLKGRFNLRINHGLPMHKKIEKYANENVAFYLHKNRNFIDKLKVCKVEYD
jgi:hypothetical protein